MTAYYNEYELTAAQWLENLIKAGHIAPGVVDRRSILDVRPNDLKGFAQCHFFAGIGVWSYALRAAGWPDDRPIWSGSCPCQPFSAAGYGAGFADERHLWPAFKHLIKERKPAIVVGEQVASSNVDPWIDLVHADMEAMGYAFGGVPFPSASVGAPHIRDRLYWVADADSSQHDRARPSRARRRTEHSDGGATGILGDAIGQGLAQRERERGILGGTGGTVKGKAAVGAGIYPGGLANGDGNGCEPGQQGREAARYGAPAESDRGAGGLADDARIGRREERADAGGVIVGDRAQWLAPGSVDGGSDLRPGPTNGFWRDADWLGCRDGKWRPVEPGTFPLVNGAAGRVGRLRADWHTPAGKEGQGHRASRLRGYGNAINAVQAEIFIRCVMECRP